jgi:hypothetical protein
MTDFVAFEASSYLYMYTKRRKNYTKIPLNATRVRDCKQPERLFLNGTRRQPSLPRLPVSFLPLQANAVSSNSGALRWGSLDIAI